MHVPSRRFARAWLLLQALLILTLVPALRAQDLQPPDHLWNIATGEMMPGADVLKSKDFGAIVQDNGIHRRWKWWLDVPQPEGLNPGDIILAVDGMRIYGSREFELARFRDPLASSMTLLVNHEGDLKWVKFHDLQPGRELGIQFDTDAEKDRILAAVENLGLPLTDEKVRTSLLQLPAQAAAELDAWSKNSSASSDTAWLQDFIALFTALQTRNYAATATPSHQPPIPFFQCLEKFYVELAAENKSHEVAPDLAKTGETPEFYALALPVPDYLPPFGDIKFSDRRFQSLLGRKYALNDQPDSEIVTAAQKYATSGTDGLALYMDQVRAALLDPANHGNLPYDSGLAHAVSGNLLIQSLADKMKDINGIDWPIDAYAMIALKWETGNAPDIAPLLDALGQKSPYLARLAVGGLYFARHETRNRWRLLDDTKKVLAKNNNFLGPNAPVLYQWALDNIQPQAITLGLVSGNPLPDPYYLLSGAPYAEVVALKSAAPTAAQASNP